MIFAGLLLAYVGLLAAFLQGCAQGGSPTPAPTPAPTPPTIAPPGTKTVTVTTTLTTTVPSQPPLGTGIRGVCYGALPCTGVANCEVGIQTPEDMTSVGYENLWGAKGRDDFGIMKALGANAVRLYHPIGYESDPNINGGKQPEPDHSLMLNAAQSSGLNVFAAVHQDLPCVNDDCFVSWSTAVKRGLASGFSKNSRWHPAVWAVNMINEVDAMVPNQDAHKYVKRIISAVDGLLAAEASLGVKGNVNLTNCFTTAIAKPLGSDSASVYHGFSSMEAWIKDTSLIDYVPKSTPSLAALAQEVDRRWVHCVNAQIPWSGLKSMIAPNYARFLPRPWIVGEMGFNGAHTDDIQKQLEDMSAYSTAGHGYVGNFFFQFQTAYFKGGGSELNYGMFGLGSSSLKYSVTLWQGKSEPVQCLTSRLWPFEQPGPCGASCNHRAQAVAKAWGGNLVGEGLCLNSIPLVPTGVGHESVAVDMVV